MELTPTQIRVLGCLVEKEATTPEHYPLSSNALVQACNQKNNRDPLTSCTEREIDAVLLELRQLGLVRTVHAANARVPKHRHVLDEAWGLTRGQLAVLAVLMLRGPNTANEGVSLNPQRHLVQRTGTCHSRISTSKPPRIRSRKCFDVRLAANHLVIEEPHLDLLDLSTAELLMEGRHNSFRKRACGDLILHWWRRMDASG
jgi:hypothetical protein